MVFEPTMIFSLYNTYSLSTYINTYIHIHVYVSVNILCRYTYIYMCAYYTYIYILIPYITHTLSTPGWPYVLQSQSDHHFKPRSSARRTGSSCRLTPPWAPGTSRRPFLPPAALEDMVDDTNPALPHIPRP